MRMFLSMLIMAMFLMTGLAFAQMPEIPASGSFQLTVEQLVELFKNWEVISSQMKIAMILVMIIGVVKNSAFESYFKFFGKWKPVVAPTLSLIVAFLFVQPFTLATALAAITTGVAAGFLSQILDALKTIPGLGSVYVTLIDIIGKLLGKPEKGIQINK